MLRGAGEPGGGDGGLVPTAVRREGRASAVSSQEWHLPKVMRGVQGRSLGVEYEVSAPRVFWFPRIRFGTLNLGSRRLSD